MSAGIDFLMAMATNNGKKINVCVSRQRREHRPLSCGVQCGGNLCVCVCVCARAAHFIALTTARRASIGEGALQDGSGGSWPPPKDGLVVVED